MVSSRSIYEGTTMIANVRATYSSGVLTPLEPLDLEEGKEVTLSIDDAARLSVEESRRMTRSAAGRWKGTHDPDELLRNIYSDRLIQSRPEARV